MIGRARAIRAALAGLLAASAIVGGLVPAAGATTVPSPSGPTSSPASAPAATAPASTAPPSTGPAPSASPTSTAPAPSDPPPGAPYPVSGPIGDAWAAAGGAAGYLGAPVGPETCGQPGNGCFQQFANGYIFYSPTTGAWAVNGAILDRYAATGHNRGFLSYPTGPETCGQPGNGCFQQFANGYIFYSPTTGAWAVNGAILDRYAATGHNRGFLSYPTGPETCGQPGNGCFQQFANGYIFYSPATGAWAVNGAILDRYAATGHNRGFLSYPTGPETCGQPGNGCFQQFANGYIFYSPATGAWAVNGAILDRYASYGHNRGTLGYPTSSETCSGGECLQTFQAGLIGWSGGSTAVYAMSECQTLNDGRSVYGADGSSRVTFAVAEGYAQTRITAVNCFRVAGLFVPQWITDGQVGASGFKAPGVPSGPTRYNYSPSGSYTVTEAFGVGNPGTSLAYTTLNPRSRWGGNPGTDTYNKYFESDSWVGYDENMWYFASRAAHDYRQGAVINYNRPPDSPIIQDAGFAIFLHMNKVPTAGCIALDDWAVVDFLQRSRSGDRIIMGVRSALFR